MDEYWDAAYVRRGSTGVSWYEPRARISVELIRSLKLPHDAPIIDVGGGASTLAHELAKLGYSDVTVLDVSEKALQHVAGRSGDAVALLHADLMGWRPEREYTLWHDRAVLHFFTGAAELETYLGVLDKAVSLGGFVVLGTFAPDGPEMCSGLPVKRYAATDLAELIGDKFVQRAALRDEHVTPGGAGQQFSWAVFQRSR